MSTKIDSQQLIQCKLKLVLIDCLAITYTAREKFKSIGSFFRVQRVAAGLHHCEERSCTADAVSPAGKGRDLEFGHGASKYSPTLRGHRGIFNIHRLMPADRIPV